MHYDPNDFGQPNFDRNNIKYQKPSSTPKGAIAAVVAVAIIGVIFAACVVNRLFFSNKSTDSIPAVAEVADSEEPDSNPSEMTASSERSTIVAEVIPFDAEDTPGVGATNAENSLFNRPLTYAGTVSPGGAASLNITLFQNGRIEGSLDYSSGKSMPLYGSYTWTDNGHRMNVNLTLSSRTDASYSESWSGTSSPIKENLNHTLSFSRINTSMGESKKANFALKQ